MEFLNKLSKNIRDARLASGMTQRELAQRIGTTNSAISMYEHSKRMPNVQLLVVMSDVLNVPLDEIVPDVSLCRCAGQDDENQTSIFDVLDGEEQN